MMIDFTKLVSQTFFCSKCGTMYFARDVSEAEKFLGRGCTGMRYNGESTLCDGELYSLGMEIQTGG